MRAKPRHRRYLTIDELAPVVEAAACYRYDRSYWHRYRVPAHHLLLVESGGFEAKTPEGTFQAGPGDLVCFHPTDLNQYGTLGPTLLYEVGLRFAPPPRHLLTLSLDEFGPLPTKVSLGNAFVEMRQVFETFCIEITQPGSAHRLRLIAAVHDLLAILAGVLTRDPNGLRHLDPWQRLRLRLDTELSTELAVAPLARQMGLSRYYFNRVFKQRFGVTPRAYHMHARMCEAARLLRGTDKPIKALAYELGFSNAKVFTRAFKAHLQVLPSDLRHGAEPASGEAPTTGGRLFVMNTLLVAPETPANWYRRFIPRPAGAGYRLRVEWEPRRRA